MIRTAAATAAPPLATGHRRVYHHHVRKSAGTSLDSAFWELGGIAEKIMRHPREVGERVSGNGLTFVRANAALIEAGDYFFASSHVPAYLLRLPAATFTVTILRDPAARVVSYYRYLRWARSHPDAFELDPFVAEVAEEGRFIDGGARFAAARLSRRRLATESAIQALGPRQFAVRLARLARRGEGFADFLGKVPPRALMNQLYMFSPRFDPEEAAERVLACDAVCFTETFAPDLAGLGQTLGLKLETHHGRRLGDLVSLDRGEEELLRERLEPEYRMLELIRTGTAAG